jgi:hypothetical protein
MPKYTIEVRQIWEIETKDGEDWGELLDKSQELWWKEGVEIDAVTLFSNDIEVIDVEGEENELCEEHQIELDNCEFCNG